MTPATPTGGRPGTPVRYAMVPVALGQLLVAATERGICAVALGGDASALEVELRREFPNATIANADAAVAAWAERVAKLVDGDTGASDIPLDIAGTPFQWRVWQQLRRIPRGETRSYNEIAAEIGYPTAARAVARACATNPAALVIPCHRVVRKDGALSGYRWGIERKRRLLDREQAAD